jgi:hypothetical protein
MPTGRDGVRFRGKTGSHRRRAKPTRLTQLRHLLRFGDVWTMPVMRGNLDPRRQDDLPPEVHHEC